MAPMETMQMHTYRMGLILSFKKKTANNAPKMIEVSRSAATDAIGALVMAHNAKL